MFVFTLKYNILQIETNWYLNLTPDTDTEHRTPSYYIHHFTSFFFCRSLAARDHARVRSVAALL